MEQLSAHPFGIVMIVVLAVWLIFWLAAPMGTVAKSLTFVGTTLQNIFAWVKSKF